MGVVGDAGGGLTLLHPNQGILAELPPTNATQSPITALASFAGAHRSIIILSGHRDGTLQWRALLNSNALTSSGSGSVPHIQSGVLHSGGAGWVVLDVVGWRAGRARTMVNIAGTTVDGAVFWARAKIHVESVGTDLMHASNKRKKPEAPPQYGHPVAPFVSSWDRSYSSYSHVDKHAAVVAGVFAQKSTIQVVTSHAEVTWGPLAGNTGNRSLRQPSVPCRYASAVRKSGGNGTLDDALVLEGGVGGIMDVGYPSTPRMFVPGTTGRIVALHLGAAPGRPVCNVIGWSGKGGGVGVGWGKEGEEERPTATIESLASLPGYVVAVTSDHRLKIVNVSGHFLRPVMKTVVEVALSEMLSSVGSCDSSTMSVVMKRTLDTIVRRMKSSYYYFNNDMRTENKGDTKTNNNKVLLAAAPTRQPPSSAPPTATGLVLLTQSPNQVALFATSLPFNPSSYADRTQPTFRVGLLTAVQPLLVAGTIGVALYKARSYRRRQAAMKTMWRQRTQTSYEYGRRELGDEGVRREHREKRQEIDELYREARAKDHQIEVNPLFDDNGDGNGSGSEGEDGSEGDEVEGWEGEGHGVVHSEGWDAPFPWERRRMLAKKRAGGGDSRFESTFLGGGSGRRQRLLPSRRPITTTSSSFSGRKQPKSSPMARRKVTARLTPANGDTPPSLRHLDAGYGTEDGSGSLGSAFEIPIPPLVDRAP